MMKLALTPDRQRRWRWGEPATIVPVFSSVIILLTALDVAAKNER